MTEAEVNEIVLRAIRFALNGKRTDTGKYICYDAEIRGSSALASGGIWIAVVVMSALRYVDVRSEFKSLLTGMVFSSGRIVGLVHDKESSEDALELLRGLMVLDDLASV